MWTANTPYILQGCSSLGLSPDTTSEQLGYMKTAIQKAASLVDRRFILATMMQESIGCVNVGKTNTGISNPGLMQSHNGASFIGSTASASAQAASIQQMIVDGTQGTSSGDGEVQGINKYGNVYDAARVYNSGSDDGTDLNDAEGATESYVVDIANRLTGWVAAAKKSCS